MSSLFWNGRWWWEEIVSEGDQLSKISKRRKHIWELLFLESTLPLIFDVWVICKNTGIRQFSRPLSHTYMHTRRDNNFLYVYVFSFLNFGRAARKKVSASFFFLTCKKARWIRKKGSHCWFPCKKEKNWTRERKNTLKNWLIFVVGSGKGEGMGRKRKWMTHVFSSLTEFVGAKESSAVPFLSFSVPLPHKRSFLRQTFLTLV